MMARIHLRCARHESAKRASNFGEAAAATASSSHACARIRGAAALDIRCPVLVSQSTASI